MIVVLVIMSDIRCVPQRYEDEEWKEGEDEEQEAGNGSRGGLLHDDREEEGEHDDGDAVVDHEEQDEAGVALGQEAAEAEDQGDEHGVDQDHHEQGQEVRKPKNRWIDSHHLKSM